MLLTDDTILQAKRTQTFTVRVMIVRGVNR